MAALRIDFVIPAWIYALIVVYRCYIGTPGMGLYFVIVRLRKLSHLVRLRSGFPTIVQIRQYIQLPTCHILFYTDEYYQVFFWASNNRPGNRSQDVDRKKAAGCGAQESSPSQETDWRIYSKVYFNTLAQSSRVLK